MRQQLSVSPPYDRRGAPTVRESVAPSAGVSQTSWAKAILIRAFEERLLTLFSEGRIFGTVHTCIGQEFTGIAVSESLIAGDLIYSNHRCHGHYIARTDDVEGLMAEIMGRETGICGGRGGSQHICNAGVYSNGIQGGIAPVATGLALAQKLGATGNVVTAFIGDGTLGEGALYEAMNIASRWDVPLLIVLENNLYAQSTYHGQTTAGEILKRPQAFDIRSAEASTWDLPGLFAAAADAVGYVRTESRPFFLRIDTYRLMAHSKGDDDRDKSEVASYALKDPINRLKETDPELFAGLRDTAVERVEAAARLANSAPFTAPFVAPSEPSDSLSWQPVVVRADGERVVNRIYAALREAFEKDPRLVCIGEDIEGPYGGAFKVTKDLSLLFPGRVRNTPIAEAAIVGVSNGLALGGHVAMCEIMFGDFMGLAMDQILNHAAKFRYMYNDQVTVPLIIRTPMGGKRGYGPTHSQSIEKHFLGIPDTTVIALNHRVDPYDVYRHLLDTVTNPTIVIENKLLYGMRLGAAAPGGFEWQQDGGSYPTVRLTSSQPADVTIVCYGGMLPDAERAVDRLVDEYEIIPEIICPMGLFPLDIRPIIESIRSSRRLLTVEEGQGFCALGAEVLARIQESAPGVLRASRRLTAARAPIPSSKPAEELMLPGVDTIVAAAVEVYRDG